MERVGGRQGKMEGHCSAGQSPQWAVVLMEGGGGGGGEEEGEEKKKKKLPSFEDSKGQVSFTPICICT